MEVFKGPLGSHLNYIRYIALDNCLDYFNYLKECNENGLNKTPEKYNRLRLFLNAIESLNNILDYYYHEYKEELKLKKESDFKKIIFASYRILRDINDIANAYKHCIRRDKKMIHAHDLIESKIKISINNEAQIKSKADIKVNVTNHFDSIEDEEIIGEAFRFWNDYQNNPDINKFKV